MCRAWHAGSVLLTVFLLGCFGSSGPSPSPIIHAFKADREQVELGEAVDLQVQFEHGTGRIEPEPGGLEGPGTVRVRPASTTTYRLTVTNHDGARLSRELEVRVAPGLAVQIEGLDGIPGQVSITNFGGFRRTLQASQTLTRMAPGTYIVSADPVLKNGHRFQPRRPRQKVVVTTGTRIAVHYLPPSFSVNLPGAVPLAFVLIPSGTFVMGSDDPEEGKFEPGPAATPAHPVTLASAFYLARTPTTRAQWESLAADPLGRPPANPGFVANNVSYLDIKDTFLPALERHAPGRGFSLPSEAEWEYACRAGTRTRYFFGPDETHAEHYFKRWGDPDYRDWTVGRKQPNPWGLYDLAGLCLQWCEDVDHDDYFEAPIDGSPWLEPTGSEPLRILRGGTPFQGEGRSAGRHAMSPARQDDWTGFRLKASEPGIGDAHP